MYRFYCNSFADKLTPYYAICFHIDAIRQTQWASVATMVYVDQDDNATVWQHCAVLSFCQFSNRCVILVANHKQISRAIMLFYLYLIKELKPYF